MSNDLLERIDELAAPTGRCRVCDESLSGNGPPVDFCGELHQMLWASRRAGRSPAPFSGPALFRGVVISVDTTAFEAALGVAQERLREIQEAVAGAVQPVAQKWAEGWRQALHAAITAGIVEEPPVDPMARALHLRQHRNTGPQVHADPRRNGRRNRQ